MVGTFWILDLLNILDHFAFWTRPLSSLENDVLIFFSLQCKIQGIFLAKKVVGHNFWTEGPTDLWSTFLSCIFDALLGDTPLDHIFSHMPICPYAYEKINLNILCGTFSTNSNVWKKNNYLTVYQVRNWWSSICIIWLVVWNFGVLDEVATSIWVEIVARINTSIHLLQQFFCSFQATL